MSFSIIVNQVMVADEGSWRKPAFRQCVVDKLDEAIQRSGMSTSKKSIDMENHIFQKAKSKEEYFGFLARLILHIREMTSKRGIGGQEMLEPIGALQNMASHRGIVEEPPPNTATNRDFSEDVKDIENWLVSNINSCSIPENNV